MTHIFIVNPAAGQSHLADALREKLTSIENFKFFIFVTRRKGAEFELVQKIKHFFDGEKLRIYCCGGSGTIRNIITAFGDISDTEFAFFPCGNTNDFLKVCEAPTEDFMNIEALINGKVVDVDYIKSNHGIALNTISMGLDADMEKQLHRYEFLGSFIDNLPYVLAAFHSLFVAESKHYKISIDNVSFEKVSAEVVLANGDTLGGGITVSENSNITDGFGSYLIASKSRAFRQVPVFMSLVKKDFEKAAQSLDMGRTVKFSIKKADGTSFTANYDGETVADVTHIDAEIVKHGLHFVMPVLSSRRNEE